MFVPSSDTCCDGANSTMWSVTERSQSISLFHRDLRSADMGSRRRCSPNTEAADFTFVYATVRTLKKQRDGSIMGRRKCMLACKISDGIGESKSGGHPFARAGHVLPKQQLGEFLLHQIQVCSAADPKWPNSNTESQMVSLRNSSCNRPDVFL